MTALATITDLEATTGRTLVGDTDRVTRINRVLEMASAVVRTYTGQLFDLVTGEVVTLRPDRDGRFRLKERPVVSVASVTDSSAVALTNVEFNTDGWLLYTAAFSQVPGPLFYLGAAWPLTVTYTHGYATIPADVVMVVCSMAGRVVANPAGIRSEMVGDYSVTYTIPGTGEAIGLALSRPEMDVLRSYRWPSV